MNSTTDRTLSEMLADLYTPDEAETWWISPNKLLGGRTPRALMLEDREPEILRLVQQIIEGIYL